MSRHWLRLVFVLDRLHFAWVRARWGDRLQIDSPVSPNLRFARLRIEPGGQLVIGPGFATERQAGNRFWIGSEGSIRLDAEVWLRTEFGRNLLTVFPGGCIEIGPRSLVNGAMIHAKREIRIGADARLGFGVRIFDADLHSLDSLTPERIAPVHIGARVWLGANVLVLRGVSIGDDVVVGAGSVVTNDIPAGVLAVGAPARPLRRLASREGCD
ncbi:MAG: acyltransferase [Myxococcota bacterium]